LAAAWVASRTAIATWSGGVFLPDCRPTLGGAAGSPARQS
jgi:hypothetical protein